MPGGGLHGGDVLSVTFRVRNRGVVPHNGAVTVTAISEGFDARVQGVRTDDGSASNYFEIEFAGQGYGRTQTFMVTAVADDEIDEANTSNNTAEVAVTLPEKRRSDTFSPC